MACATLKRSLEFDPVHSPTSGRPAKRRRCMPMCVSPPLSSSQSTSSVGSPASVSSSSTTLTAPSTPPRPVEGPSPFAELQLKITPEQIATNIRDEVRRLQKRKQLHFEQDAGTSGTESHMREAPLSPSALIAQMASLPAQLKDRPIFNVLQVRVLCERMLRDYETKLRKEYDEVLYNKLNEQYNLFVRFANDQIHKNFEATAVPSYLS